MEIHAKLENLRTNLYRMIEQTPDLTSKLMDLADEIDAVFKGVKISKIVGASVAIGGGIMTGVGFALSFCTFGVSFGLSVAGASIAGLGGATIGIAQLVDSIHSSVKFKAAEKAINEYASLIGSLKTNILEIGIDLELLGNIDIDFKEWRQLIGKLVLGGCRACKAIGWNVIVTSIRTGRAIVRGMALGGSKAGLTAFKTVGTTTARAAGHIGLGVIGILLIPVDIYTLVDTAVEVHKKKPHRVSEEIRKMAKMLYVDCPTRLQVDTAIKKTLDSCVCRTTSRVLYKRRPVNAVSFVDLNEYYTL